MGDGWQERWRDGGVGRMAGWQGGWCAVGHPSVILKLRCNFWNHSQKMQIFERNFEITEG